jgi:hypothetical protein
VDTAKWLFLAGLACVLVFTLIGITIRPFSNVTGVSVAVKKSIDATLLGGIILAGLGLSLWAMAAWIWVATRLFGWR